MIAEDLVVSITSYRIFTIKPPPSTKIIKAPGGLIEVSNDTLRCKVRNDFV